MTIDNLELDRIRNHIIALMAAVLLAACSDNSNELVPYMPQPTEQENGLTMDLSASATDYVNAANEGEENLNGAREMITRSWTPPSGYFLYGDIYDDHGNLYVNFNDINLANKSIDAFFTRANGEEPADDPDEESDYYSTRDNYPYHGRLRYKSSTDNWQLSIRKVDVEKIKYGDYYVYGFIPGNAADDATIEKLTMYGSDYKDGAVLTIKGLRTAGYDACVIIGAKEGPDKDHDNGLVACDFKINLKKTAGDVKNYLYLLFDHLGSALTIGIKVDGDYNVLRTIKLKQLTLQTATDTELMTEKADVEVKLDKNGSGTPITKLTYTPTGSSGTGSPVYQSDNGQTLTTSYQSFLTHFLPIEDVTTVVITCIYDVYDKKGNLLHKDCKATNTIKLSDVIPYFPGVKRGWKYNINMTVVPTYLYVLSDPDLDNPTMVVDGGS